MGLPVAVEFLDSMVPQYVADQVDYRNQSKVIVDMCSQLASGSQDIAGVMIESNLEEGNQAIPTLEEVRSRGCQSVLECLTRGVSVTDARISWKTTVDVLKDLSQAVRARRTLYSSATSPVNTPPVSRVTVDGKIEGSQSPPPALIPQDPSCQTVNGDPTTSSSASSSSLNC